MNEEQPHLSENQASGRSKTRSTADELAQFQLLADPETIAGGNRLGEPVVARKSHPQPPSPHSPRLDFKAASELAQQAKRQTQASREALAAA
ncbi:MAG: hypothetical protein V3T64_10660 [Myxococcota bacterium]